MIDFELIIEFLGITAGTFKCTRPICISLGQSVGQGCGQSPPLARGVCCGGGRIVGGRRSGIRVYILRIFWQIPVGV
jgi:hypothetical protein